MRKMKKNIGGRALALILTAAMLCACSSTGGSETEQTDKSSGNKAAGSKSSDKKSGTVELSVWAEEANYDMLEGMIESFKEEYKGEARFEITLVENSDAKTKDVLLGDIHNAADLFSFADDQLPGMVAAGAIEPVPNAEEIKAANLEEAVGAASIGDTLYAYPMTADNGYFMYYNKKYFTEEDVQTLDGMLAAAKKAGKKINIEATSGWYMYTFFGNTGLEFGLNDDGITNYCNWNSKEGDIKGTDIVQSLLDIFATGAVNNGPDSEFVKGAKKGKLIAGISGVWNAIELMELWGDDYAAVKLPVYTCAGQQIQMSSFTGYKMMGVNYYSEQKEWACKLADWLTNEENQNIRFVDRNQGPSNIRAAESEEVMKVPAIQAVIAQSEFGSLQRVGQNYWAPFEPFAQVIVNGNPDHLKLQDIIDNLVNGITASTIQ